ncbi:AraC family transcriptional regulator [Polyangium sp. 15x6]|uniref:AraC family transcriptional regulator n=1 Tax=Polyangium sp. 15x6 TaxID=3042687 RepID=UPI00249B7803|nr:AraC family transcriptional regulator [Polyangium sp. 15x6]MDI3291229.1 AraC family transcriptional regulator [Polyangium sp. 15x6]
MGSSARDKHTNELLTGHLPPLEATDVDEARGIFRRLYGGLSRVEPGRGSFGWYIRRAAAGGVHFHAGSVQDALEYSSEGIQQRFVLVLGSRGQWRGRHLGQDVDVVPGRSGIIISPDRPLVSRSEAGYVNFTIAIDAPVLEGHMQSLTGRPMRGRLEFDPAVNLETPGGESFHRIAQAFVYELNRPDGSPRLLVTLREALLTSLSTCLPHSHQEQLTPPPRYPSPGYLRKAEEFLDAHLDEPLTMTAIANEIGISSRALQAAFRSHRGCSPMQFLKERRLERARQGLLGAELGATVAEIATAAGMDHLGRFSVEYKKRFGESPSETMRRRVR